MTENPKKRRRLVMSDVYAYESKISYENQASGDANDQIPALLDKLKKSHDLLKMLEHKLKSCDKENERLRRDAEKEKNKYKEDIKTLMQETNEAKGRSISLYNQVTDSKDVLHKIKSKHLSENDDMQRKLLKLTEEKTQLEEYLAEMEQQQTLYTLSDSSNKRKQQHMVDTFQHELQSYKDQIESLNSLTKEQTQIIQQQTQSIIALSASQLSTENSDEINDLRQLNKTLAEKLLSLEVANKQLDKDVTYYKSNFENNDILKTEMQSLALKVEKLTQIEKEYNSLKIKHTKMEANVNAWYCYITDRDQTPQNYIVNITKELEEARYLKAELNQYKKQITKRDGLVAKLEAHMEELKKELLKKQQVIASHERASHEFKDNNNLLSHHIEVLQRQLRLYDTEEKEYMNDTYDAIKSHRITELEALLKENEEKLGESAIKLAELQKNTVKPIEPVLTSDKTLSHLVSQLTQEIENNEEQMRTLYAQDTMLKQELDTTKAQLQKLVEAVGQTTELKDKVHISYTPLPEDAAQGGDTKKMRILELKENPASLKLSARLSKMSDLENVVAKYIQNDLENNDMVPKATLEYQVNEAKALAKKVSTLEKRIVRLNESFRDRANEMRDLIKSILGYDVILKSDGLVRVVSDFVDGKDLTFLVKSEANNQGQLRIIGDRKDEYMPIFEDQFETHIIGRQSIPAFLGSIVVDLQTSATHMDQDDEYQEGEYHQQSDDYYMDDAPMTVQPGYSHVLDGDDEEEDEELDYGEEEDEEEEEEEVQTQGQYAYQSAMDLENIAEDQLRSLLAMRDNVLIMANDAINYNTMMPNTYTGELMQDYESQDEDNLLEEEEEEEEEGAPRPSADSNVITLIDSSEEEEEDEEIQHYEEGDEEEMPEYEDDEETIVEDDATLHYRDSQPQFANVYQGIMPEDSDDDQAINESQSSQGEKEELLEESEEGLVLEESEEYEQTEETSPAEEASPAEETSTAQDHPVTLNEQASQNNDEMMVDQEEENPDVVEEFMQDELVQEEVQEEVPEKTKEPLIEGQQDDTLQEETLNEGQDDMMQEETIQEEAQDEAIQQDQEELMQVEQDDQKMDEDQVVEQDNSSQVEHTAEAGQDLDMEQHVLNDEELLEEETMLETLDTNLTQDNILEDVQDPNQADETMEEDGQDVNQTDGTQAEAQSSETTEKEVLEEQPGEAMEKEAFEEQAGEEIEKQDLGAQAGEATETEVLEAQTGESIEAEALDVQVDEQNDANQAGEAIEDEVPEAQDGGAIETEVLDVQVDPQNDTNQAGDSQEALDEAVDQADEKDSQVLDEQADSQADDAQAENVPEESTEEPTEITEEPTTQEPSITKVSAEESDVKKDVDEQPTEE